MNHRLLAPIAWAGLFLTMVWPAPAQLTAQAPATASKSTTPAKRWTLSRTPDGQPDLQGFWTNTTYVSLERPKDVTKDFFTKEEVAERIKRAAAAEAEQTEPGTIPDVHYDFSSGWTVVKDLSP